MTRRICFLVSLALLSCWMEFAAHGAEPADARHPSLPPTGTLEGLGTNIHFTNPRPGEMEMLATGGFRWVRMDFTWGATERTKGEYDFSAYDTLMDALEARGIRALFILDYSNNLYESDRSVSTLEGRKAYARWAAAAAAHFEGRGILWEIWNEPNIKKFWQPEPNLDDYTAMALAACRAIHQTAPQEAIIGPATSTIDLEFLEGCFEAGLLKYWDAVSVHPYRKSPPETVIPEYHKLRQLIADYTSEGKEIPILSAEWGYSSVWNGFDLDKQGRMLPRQWLINLSHKIPLSIWYDWHDDGPDPEEPEHHFGTVTHQYHADRDPVYGPKPAYLAAQTLTRALKGTHFRKRVRIERPDDYVLLFSNGRQQKLAAWTTSSEEHEIHIPSSACKFDVMSHVGKARESISTTGETLTVRVSRAPLYLTAKSHNPRLETAMAAFPMKAWLIPGPGKTVTVRIQQFTDSEISGQAKLVDATGLDLETIRKPFQIGAGTFQQKIRFPLKSSPTGQCRVGLRLEDQSGNTLYTVAPRRIVFLDGELLKSCHVVAEGDSDVLAEWDMQLVAPPTLLGDSSEKVYFRRLDFSGWKAVRRKPSSRWSDSRRRKSSATRIVRVDYRFGSGWRFLRLVPPQGQPHTIDGKPTGFGMWIYGDGQRCSPRLRVEDATGQTWQPSGPTIDWNDWRYIEFPLSAASGHWGGAEDGKIHFPVAWDSMFLLDNTARRHNQGTVFLSTPVVLY
ncbi:MAG: cellulase family glycosylhydrolase [Planctomycetota bacterium]